MRGSLDALEATGQLECARRRGVPVWALTSAGRQRLGAGPTRGREALDEAVGLLDAEGVPPDAWFERGERLGRLSWQLASATYCAREWPEPDDALADVDDHGSPGDEQLDPDRREHLGFLRMGRRNKRLWPGIDYSRQAPPR